MNVTIRPVPRVEGEASVPGDKSITHRALLLGALGNGTSHIVGDLSGGDCLASAACLARMGIAVGRDSSDVLRVAGRGLYGLQPSTAPLDCARSGTTMRLLAGLLAGQRFDALLTGHPQLLGRPMGRVVDPLHRMGAQIDYLDGDRPPLAIRGRRLHGVRHNLPVASAQVKSALILAGLYAEGRTEIIEPSPSRDHTERMLRARGAQVHSEGLGHALDGPAESLAALDTIVPGDASSAAFLLVAGLLAPAGEVRLTNVGINPTRTGLLDVLAAMGAQVHLENSRDEGGEPVADLVVWPQTLTATDISGDLVVRAIDEFPIIALAATQAQGITRVRDAAELRVKESDRITALARALRALGARIEEHPDGFDVEGPTPLHGAAVDSAGDHRLAMTLTVAGLIASGETTILDAERVEDSFPGFFKILGRLAQGALP